MTVEGQMSVWLINVPDTKNSEWYYMIKLLTKEDNFHIVEVMSHILNTFKIAFLVLSELFKLMILHLKLSIHKHKKGIVKIITKRHYSNKIMYKLLKLGLECI